MLEGLPHLSLCLTLRLLALTVKPLRLFPQSLYFRIYEVRCSSSRLHACRNLGMPDFSACYGAGQFSDGDDVATNRLLGIFYEIVVVWSFKMALLFRPIG
jgi:hypothetical protein